MSVAAISAADAAGRKKRRVRVAVLTSAAIGLAVATAAGPGTAAAAPDPCATSEVARTIGKVAASTGDYLDAHPQANQALTTATQQQSGPQSLAAVKTYLDANPQVAKDLQALQQPLQTLGTRCKLPISLPQVMGLVQNAQQQGGVPAVPGLPAAPGLPTAHSPAAAVSAPVGAVPGQRSLPGVITAATPPQPGPAATSTR